MAKPPMVQRTYKVPADLYEQAMERCAEQQHNLSDVLRTALKLYVRGELNPDE